ncbi:MAG: RdgB/HAM1 family non-canonical purine NTP pyrophosphatase [Candidatus Kariarchaeaceae archaeon]
MFDPSLPLSFVTSNHHKFDEASVVAQSFSLSLTHVKQKYSEVQADSLEEVAMFSALTLLGSINPPFFLEDAGLFIPKLNGFPGPYSSYALQTLGNESLLTLLFPFPDLIDRQAYFLSVVAFVSDEGVRLFKGRVDGFISPSARSKGYGFGFDPIFIPNETPDFTFAELPSSEKNDLSHRSKALSSLFSYLSTIHT